MPIAGAVPGAGATGAAVEATIGAAGAVGPADEGGAAATRGAPARVRAASGSGACSAWAGAASSSQQTSAPATASSGPRTASPFRIGARSPLLAGRGDAGLASDQAFTESSGFVPREFQTFLICSGFVPRGQNWLNAGPGGVSACCEHVARTGRMQPTRSRATAAFATATARGGQEVALRLLRPGGDAQRGTGLRLAPSPRDGRRWPARPGTCGAQLFRVAASCERDRGGGAGRLILGANARQPPRRFPSRDPASEPMPAPSLVSA